MIRTRRRRPLLLAPALAVLMVTGALGACASDGDADASATTDAGPPAGSSLPPGAESLVGRYAHFDVVAYQDQTMKTLIISTGFSDLSLRDGEIWNQMTFCHADTVVDLPVEVSIADEATRAILPVATPVEVTEVDGALHVSRPPTPTAIGIALDDPATERLPADPNDPRIVDADGDGNPGITSTLKVSDDRSVEIYLARREIFAYDLVQTSPDRLVGSITDTSEQLVLGSSSPDFATATQWVQLDDPERNPVIWQRVEDDMTCDELAARRAELFPPNPTVDW